MSSVFVGVIGLFAVLLLFLTGIEIAYAMAIVGFLGFCYLANPVAAMNLIAKDFFDVFSSHGPDCLQCGNRPEVVLLHL
jgi:C4-dicarboxylate transporter DctM subunit